MGAWVGSRREDERLRRWGAPGERRRRTGLSAVSRLYKIGACRARPMVVAGKIPVGLGVSQRTVMAGLQGRGGKRGSSWAVAGAGGSAPCGCWGLGPS